MESLLQDLRFSLRGLLRNPGLTAVAVLSLGIGIGANTTVFTWLQTFVLKPLPAVQQYARMVTLHTRAPGRHTWSLSYPDLKDWRAQSRTMDITGFDFAQAGMRTENGATDRVWIELATDNFFDVLGVRPVIGRTFQPGEEDQTAQVVVLGWSFWQRRFHGDSAVVGRTLTLNGQTFTIVGVAAPRFGGPAVGLRMDMFAPLTTRSLILPGGDRWKTTRGWQTFDGIGLLHPGVTFEQASLELDALAKAAGRAGGMTNHQGAVVRHMDETGAAAWLKPVFSALLGITAVVLLIACANVANLLLARAAGRRREIAIRLAVGAARTRLIRQLLTESGVLAVVSGGLGLVIALWGRDLMNGFVPAAPFPIGVEYRIDANVLLFALLTTVLTALSFGLVPALQASRPELVPTLKDDVSGAFGGRHRLQSTLVVGQVALSLVSLVCAGLFVRSLLNARVADVGFDDPEHALIIATDFALANVRGDSAEAAMTDVLLAKVRAVPGVQAAAISDQIPLGFGGNSSSSADIEGYQPKPNENMSIRTNWVGADYFRAMRIAVLQGRAIQDGDERPAAMNIVVNQAFAARYFPGRSAIGRWVDQGSGHTLIVGIARTGKYSQLTEDPVPMIYQPVGRLRPPDNFNLVVRTAGDPVALTSALRRAFQETSADLPFLDVRTLAESIQVAVFVQRIGAYMLAGFGAIALLLSAIGLYGVMSYAVSQRTREIGVRVALGAARRDVLALVMGRAIRLAGLGLAIGLAAAFGIAQLLRSQLFGISPADPLTFVAIATLLGAVALLAGWLPARRAARVDPMIALRYE